MFVQLGDNFVKVSHIVKFGKGDSPNANGRYEIRYYYAIHPWKDQSYLVEEYGTEEERDKMLKEMLAYFNTL